MSTLAPSPESTADYMSTWLASQPVPVSSTPTSLAPSTGTTATNASTAASSLNVGGLLSGFVDIFGSKLASNLADKATGANKTPATSTANVAPASPVATLPKWASPTNLLIGIGVVGGLVVLLAVVRGMRR